MFECTINTKWKEKMKDKMFTLVDFYRTEYGESIKDIKYKREYHDDYRMIITFVFEDIDIKFESVETGSTKWMYISICTRSDDKKFFDEKYDLILKNIKKIK